ncbi:ribulose-phosphate 3-epimerase [Candidatus Woesearchaeota archaeon]|jgi:ribulose-phosphate 3-epimerase|nr:ribulose-phosphate 3-epimerase [Candidatus Woesearchaeota archaeon]MBT3537154.1 ribulose-phosphate 3-epimerase [Candidatus Woesearchaeota archaeon]MBT4697719.1 ribulose-phosphate 3-epimerase [Candidatus Woesearchaeota archaeon]MBT4716577.1 ribulose-phosphate 3-epimerase [Candidatus Woesearchaeota archaeon]MBT7106536.1 ribulose-phosphate 3-epimerase [Candidatus Woesearchaeota archaeon]
MMRRIVPTVIAKSPEKLLDAIYKVKDCVDWIQLDVMDGTFAPNKSLDFDFSLPDVECRFEAHLMMDHPLEWIKKHIDEVDTFLIHVESRDDLDGVIEFVKSKGKKVGLALKVTSSLDVLEPYFDKIDQVLLMTVQIGFYGGKFLIDQVDRVKKLRKEHPELDIEVDGGVSLDTVKLVSDAGANFLASGSYIMMSDDVGKAVCDLMNAVGD